MKEKNNNKNGPKGSDARMLSLFSHLEEGEDQDGPERKREDAPPVAITRVSQGGPPDLTDGRDELNLIEFPLTLLTDRPSASMEPLVYSDTVYDSGDGGRQVARTLTITPAVGQGLPTATDGDVLLALIQLTRWSNGFTNRTVKFSRYELAKLLRWTQGGKNYDRIEHALNRWVGVTLYFDRAWWDRKQRCWVNEKFHILERVSLRTKAEGSSEFTWGEVPFASFRAENLKKIDLNLYFDLQLPTSRRLFRFLDKRFYQRPRMSFDLRNLACEHVGLSREYHNGEIKRRLLPAVRELEGVDYLELAAEDERFFSPGRGSWRAFFSKREAPPPTEGLAGELVKRGVGAPVAAALCAQFPAGHVQARLGVFDWLSENKDERVGRNPPGYLVQSIRQSYLPPADYPPAPAGPAPVPAAVTVAAAPSPDPARERAEVAERERDAPVLAYLAALPPSEYATLEVEAVAASESARHTLKMVQSELMQQIAKRRAVMTRVRQILGIPEPKS